MGSFEPPEIAGSNEQRPRVCQKCKLLTPAHLPACVECGYRPSEAVEVEKESRFVKAFLAHSTSFTYIILGINIIIFVLMIFSGGTSNIETLRAFGAKENALILKGEYWRFITPIFIHLNPIHIVSNSYGLIVLGPMVERLYGSARFIVIYLFAGIMGVVGSFIWSMILNQPGVGAGASGAIFGLLGILAISGLKYRNELPEIFRRGFVGSIVMIILITFYVGLIEPNIGNAAHFGGLAAGVLAALIIPYQPIDNRQRRPIWTFLKVFSIVLVLFSFLQAGLHYNGPKLSLDVPSFSRAIGADMNQDINDFAAAWNAGETAFKDSLKALMRANKTGEKLEEEKVLGTIERGLVELARCPSLDKKSDEYVNRLKELLGDNRAFVEKQKEGKLDDRELHEEENKYNRLDKDFCNWLETDGRNYSIRCEEKK